MRIEDRITTHRRSALVFAAAVCLAIALLLAGCGRLLPNRALDAQATEVALAVVLANAESTSAAARLTLAPPATEPPGPAPTSKLTRVLTAQPTPTPSHTPSPVPSPTATPSPTPAPPTATPTPDVARVTSSQQANVRSGPGTAYPRITQLTPGASYRVTGQNEARTWWQIDMGGRAGWVSNDLVTVQGNTAGVPVVAVAPPPAPAYRCFTPKLRFYTAHKGCCGEILGEVKDLGGRPFSGGAQVEVTVPNTSYRTLWPVTSNGDYSITALSSGNPYTVRLIGSRIRSGSFDVRYNFNEERALVDFFETRCPQAAEPEPDLPPAAALAGQVIDPGTSEPIAGARVSVAGKSVETSSDGRYTLTDLAPGQVAVLVTRDGYDPYLSAVVPLTAGETRTADFELARAGTTEYPSDPMATNQVDPAGAPTAADAERLARVQGFAGQVASIDETALSGEHIVNYRTARGLRSAAAQLNHPAWRLVDSGGASWYIIRVCGNLAVVRPPALTLPAQVVTQSNPVFRCTKRTQARTCPSADCGIAADLPTGWQSPIVGCDAGCRWVRLQGCGGGGECWVLASDGQITGDLSRFKGTPGEGAALPRYRWSTPERVSELGQGGINQAVVQDGQGRLIATWEEHLPSTATAPFYGPVHYRVWDGSRWTETMGVPGSEDHGESILTALADGSLLLAAGDMTSKYAWWRWQDGAWSPVPEMLLQAQQNASGMAGLVADGANNVYVFTPKARVWNGRAWADTNDIGFIPWRGAVRDSQGRAHVIARTYSAQPELVHRLWQDGGWQQQEVVYRAPAATMMLGSWYAAAAGPDDTLHVAWPSADADFTARVNGTPHTEWISYSRGDGNGWSPPQVAAGPRAFTKGGIDSADIALLPEGNVVIVYDYYTGNNESGICVVWGHDGSWSEPVVFTSPARGSYAHPGVGVDRQGRIHIFWWRGGESSVYYVMGTPQ